jgi:biotin synthase
MTQVTDSSRRVAPFAREAVRALYDRPLFALLDEARAVHIAPGTPETRCSSARCSASRPAAAPRTARTARSRATTTTDVGPRRCSTSTRCSPPRAARARQGSTRFCMGAAWREVKDGPAFERVLDMVRGREGARPRGLRHAGHAHGTAGDAPQGGGPRRVQPQPRHEPRALPIDHHDAHVRRPPPHARERARGGITVCSGGIIGMGESADDRCEMLRTLANLEPQPESVPINALVRRGGDAARAPAAGRPARPRADDRVRPHPDAAARVRLSAGARSCRARRSCCAMYAGANSIFYGDKLLTTPNPEVDEDRPRGCEAVHGSATLASARSANR